MKKRGKKINSLPLLASLAFLSFDATLAVGNLHTLTFPLVGGSVE